MPTLYSMWIAVWAKGRPDAYIWTVRGVTEAGVYITTPQGRTPGHLLSPEVFKRDYIPYQNAQVTA